MASSLANTKDKIAASRRICATGDYVGAVSILEPILPFSEPPGAIQAELIRVHLILGDRKTALLVLAERNVTANCDAGLYHDLLSILEAFINVSVCGDLAGALQVAVSMWQVHGSAAAFKDGDEVLVSVYE
jgi:hypothetical protein